MKKLVPKDMVETTFNPTAENMAAWIFQEIAKELNTETLRVSSLTLWETERACVRYSEENN